MSVLDAVAAPLLAAASPSGALQELALSHENPELDLAQADLDKVFAAVQQHLAEPSLVSRLEDDFARAAPALGDGATALEAFVIPSLSLLAGPAAPFVSFGVGVAVKVAVAVFKNWAARRLAAGGGVK